MNVLDFVMVGSNDHQKSGDFYDAVFEPLKLKRILKTKKYLGYAHSSDPDKVQFYVTHPVNGCLLYTSPSPRDMRRSRMPSSA